MLARQPKEVAGSADIVGGLPRVTEVFEARTPKDPAVMAEISGRVELYHDKRKGKITIRVISDSGQETDHHVPRASTCSCTPATTSTPATPSPRDRSSPTTSSTSRAKRTYVYMLKEVQNVYRAQGVPLSDKHIEIILRQMLGKVRVLAPGDTDLLPNEVVDRFQFRERNDQNGNLVRITESGDTTLGVGALVTKEEFRTEPRRGRPSPRRRGRSCSASPRLLSRPRASCRVRASRRPRRYSRRRRFAGRSMT